MSIHADDEFNLRLALDSELDDVTPHAGLADMVITRYRKGRRRRGTLFRRRGGASLRRRGGSAIRPPAPQLDAGHVREGLAEHPTGDRPVSC